MITNLRSSIFKQILLVSNLGNVQITARRLCILMLRCKGLRTWNTCKSNFQYNEMTLPFAQL